MVNTGLLVDVDHELTASSDSDEVHGVGVVPEGRLQGLDTSGLQETQIAALHAAVEIGYGMSIRPVAKAAHISPTTLYRWVKTDPLFVTAWRTIPSMLLRAARPGIYSALARKAHDGDVQAIKLSLELMRDYVPPAQRVEHTGTVTLDSMLLAAHKVIEAEAGLVQAKGIEAQPVLEGEAKPVEERLETPACGEVSPGVGPPSPLRLRPWFFSRPPPPPQRSGGHRRALHLGRSLSG